MPSLGVAFDGRNPLPALVEQARAAEAAGADTICVSSHLFLRDPFTVAAAVLAATARVHVTLMAVSPHVMHPVHMAMAAATLDELAPGRVALCVATGAPNDLAAARGGGDRAGAAGRRARGLPGRAVPHRGPPAGARPARGPDPAGRQPPARARAGRRPRRWRAALQRLVGRVRPRLARSRGRRLRRAGLVYASVADREADALGRFRRQLAITLRAPHHAENLRLAGARLDQEAVRRAVAGEDWAAAEALVGDEVVRRHTASGTPAQVRARLDAYRAAGLDELVLGGLYTSAETARAVAVARGAA
jgi:5,10-methylenetetrahydromethanopterin reductase